LLAWLDKIFSIVELIIPATLDFYAGISKALGLRVQLRPVGEASGRHVEEPQQAAWREVVEVDPGLGGHQAALVSPIQVTPITG